MPRRNDDLMDIPSIVPDTDGRSSARATSSTRPAPNRSSNSTAPSASAGLIRQLLVALVLAGLAAACAYFYYMNAQQRLLNQQLQNRLSTLESQLGVSNGAADQPGGETLGSKVKTLDESLKTANEEIRKLWGITNDKNIKSLANHESKLDEHDKNLSALQASVTELKKSVALTEKSAAEATRLANESNSAMATVGQNIAEMRNSVGTMQQRISQGDPVAREASQQAAIAQEQTEELQAKVEGLSKRVADHDESLRGIDTFRRSVNSDLNKLKQPNGSTSYPQ